MVLLVGSLIDTQHGTHGVLRYYALLIQIQANTVIHIHRGNP